MLRRVSAFGMTLARLDIRQDASRHTETLAAVTSALGLGSYADWDEAKRVDFLLTELAGRRPLIPADLKPASEVQDVLATFRMIARTPAGSLGAYVITMARNVGSFSRSSCCRRVPRCQPLARRAVVRDVRGLAERRRRDRSAASHPRYRARTRGGRRS